MCEGRAQIHLLRCEGGGRWGYGRRGGAQGVVSGVFSQQDDPALQRGGPESVENRREWHVMPPLRHPTGAFPRTVP